MGCGQKLKLNSSDLLFGVYNLSVSWKVFLPLRRNVVLILMTFNNFD